MNTNPYFVEKLNSLHYEDLLVEAAHEHLLANLAHSQIQLRWRVAGTVGSLFIKLGSWLERSARRSEQIMLDA